MATWKVCGNCSGKGKITQGGEGLASDGYIKSSYTCICPSCNGKGGRYVTTKGKDDNVWGRYWCFLTSACVVTRGLPDDAKN